MSNLETEEGVTRKEMRGEEKENEIIEPKEASVSKISN